VTRQKAFAAMKVSPKRSQVKIGAAGSDGLGYPKALRKALRMGLDCIEVAFTYGVRMTPEQAEVVGAAAAETGIVLSVHAPYYINLASTQAVTRDRSKQRILAACRMAALMGAGRVVFHAGFYQGQAPQKALLRITRAVDALQTVIARKKWLVALCPETTGKPSQFGSLAEVLDLARRTGCSFTVDFSHLLARAGGRLDYDRVLDQLPRRFHAHFSGVEYGAKGERRHVRTTAKFFRPLAAAIARRDLELTLISESPQPYRDAAMMKRVLAACFKPPAG
jgi:deoxyribonuclease-4